jgi:hypothetical protein
MTNGKPALASLIFVLEKETKNTVRYQEEPALNTPPVVGSLYVQKWALAPAYPARLTVTIAMDGAEDR